MVCRNPFSCSLRRSGSRRSFSAAMCPCLVLRFLFRRLQNHPRLLLFSRTIFRFQPSKITTFTLDNAAFICYWQEGKTEPQGQKQKKAMGNGCSTFSSALLPCCA